MPGTSAPCFLSWPISTMRWNSILFKPEQVVSFLASAACAWAVSDQRLDGQLARPTNTLVGLLGWPAGRQQARSHARHTQGTGPNNISAGTYVGTMSAESPRCDFRSSWWVVASVYFVCAEEDIDRRAAMLKKKQRLSRIPGARICLCVQRLTQRSVCTTATDWGTARFSMYPAAHRDAQSLRERRVLPANEVRCCARARKPLLRMCAQNAWPLPHLHRDWARW